VKVTTDFNVGAFEIATSVAGGNFQVQSGEFTGGCIGGGSVPGSFSCPGDTTLAGATLTFK
jgi:hypothetical protein